MKKIICICAAGLMVAALSTSCNKKCECKSYIGGVVTSTYEIELEKDHHCSDYNTPEVLGSYIECKGKL